MHTPTPTLTHLTLLQNKQPMHTPTAILLHQTLLQDKHSAENDGEDFRSFCLNYLARTGVNCFDTVGTKTKDTQSKEDMAVGKEDAQLEEEPDHEYSTEFHSFCMNFLTQSTTNDNTFDNANRESIRNNGW